MDVILKLAEHFAKFPGIGARQSKRFVYFLLKQDKKYIRELTALIESLQRSVHECARCHRFYMKKNADGNTMCAICNDAHRDHTILMVVEKDSDLEAIERSGMYHGCYFVLGGTLPILEKYPESKIRIIQLGKIVKEDAWIKEIILACAFTPEGEHTREYLEAFLSNTTTNTTIKITTLGRGLSTGTELEYSDTDTLRYALEGRK